MAAFDGLFCTDADVAGVAVADYLEIVPTDQYASGGADGLLAPGGFALSAATDFVAAGVAPEMVVILERGSDVENDLLLVDSVEPTALNLRRKGFAAGQGRPPSIVGASDVTYGVPSCLPQIIEATAALTRRFYAAGSVPGEFRHACVLAVLVALYGSAQRAGGEADNWQVKYDQYRAELAAAVEDLARRYPDRPSVVAPAVGQISYGATAAILDDPLWRVPRGY